VGSPWRRHPGFAGLQPADGHCQDRRTKFGNWPWPNPTAGNRLAGDRPPCPPGSSRQVLRAMGIAPEKSRARPAAAGKIVAQQQRQRLGPGRKLIEIPRPRSPPAAPQGQQAFRTISETLRPPLCGSSALLVQGLMRASLGLFSPKSARPGLSETRLTQFYAEPAPFWPEAADHRQSGNFRAGRLGF